MTPGRSFTPGDAHARREGKPAEVGWLHYRLAVAFCTAVVTGIMLLVVPLVFAIGGRAPEPLVLYAFVFSKWGAAVVLGAGVLGFIIGGERMAEVFGFMWGSHPFWSQAEGWLEEHPSRAALLGFALVAAVIGFFWYSFR